MAAPFSLQPKWRPIPLPHAVSRSLPVALDDTTGHLIVGDDNALSVLMVLHTQRLWFTIQARVRIEGYAIGSGVLYVQDGPVIAMWSLTESELVDGKDQGVCYAAYNVESGTHATSDTQPVDLDTVFSGTGASSQAYSAPVVRVKQTAGAVNQMVFVLAADGTIHAFDDGLTLHAERAFERAGPTRPWSVMLQTDAPQRPVLAMAELPDATDPSVVRCYLVYVTFNGSVNVVDASGDTFTKVGAWPGRGNPDVAIPPEGAWILGPAFIDGLFWTFGAPNALTAFALPPGSAPAFANAGDMLIDVSPPDHLVLGNNSGRFELLAYPSGTQYIAGDSASGGPIYPMFWLDGDPSVPAAGPRAILAFDVQATDATGNLQCNAYVASTVQAPMPALVPAFPPAASPIAAGHVEPGTFPNGPQHVAVLLARPVIFRNVLYLLVGDSSTTPSPACSVVACALDDLQAQLQPLATAEIARLTLLATPPAVHCQTVTHYEQFRDPSSVDWDQYAALGGPFDVVVHTTPPVTLSSVTADGNGYVHLSATYGDAPVSITYRGTTYDATPSNTNVPTLTWDMGWVEE